MGYRNTRKSYSIDPAKNPGPYEAIVRNVLDPGYAGSIQVEILKTLDNGVSSPTKQVVTCQYLHPFYGTTNIADINSNTDLIALSIC